MKTNDNKEIDLELLRQLYNGNHLNDSEKKRACTILYLLNQELKRRLINK